MKTKTFIGRCNDLTNQGMGVVKHDRFPFFVENLLVDELAEIEILDQKSKFGIGKVKQIIEPSPDRIPPVCPHFEECGGCQLMMLSDANQNHFKEEQFRRLFHQKVSLNPSPLTRHYRNKMTFKVSQHPFSIGLYQTKTHDVVPINYCYLQSDLMNQILNFVQAKFKDEEFDELILRESEASNGVMVIFKGKTISTEKLKLLTDRFKNIKSVYVNDNLVYGDETLIEQIGSIRYHVSSDSFFQVNTGQCEYLYNKIVEIGDFTGKETVLDLYCGVGSIGLFISKNVKRVIGVEINALAIEDANKNKLLNNINNVDFVAEDASQFLHDFNETIDVVIVDPPRKGLTQSGIEDIISTHAKKIIYVSCNPVTLKRDLELLSTHYVLETICPFDMFPQTSHVEALVLMTRE